MSEHYPDGARSHAALGLGYLATGDKDRAIESLSIAVEIEEHLLFDRFLKEAEGM